MAILQALFALIAKSAGKILNAIFGWAVRALFGRASPKEITFLSGLVAAAAAWPLLLAGLAAPKIAALLLAFVPIPQWVPSWSVRLVWLVLVIAVPLTMGITMASKAPPQAQRTSVFKRLLSGFPITIGLALAFLIMFVTVPVMRLWALLRGQISADIPLITESRAYHQVAGLTIGVLNRRGFNVKAAKPGWWVAAPSRVLRFFGGDAFGSFVPEKLEHYENQTRDLSVSFYPSGVLLRGKGQKLTWAHGLIAEATARCDGFQTTSPAAQDLEKQIKRLWKIYEDEPEAHLNSGRLLNRVSEMTHDLGILDIDFEEWQVIYRQLLQLGRGLKGQRQLFDEQSDDHPEDRSMQAASGTAIVPMATAQAQATAQARDIREITVMNKDSEMPRSPEQLSTIQLVKNITTEVAHLAHKQIELAKIELRADLKAEAVTIGGLGMGALAGLATVNLLLVTAVLALAQLMTPWLAGLMVSGVVFSVGAIVALWAWNKRVRSPLARTRHAVKEDLQWTRERLV